VGLAPGQQCRILRLPRKEICLEQMNYYAPIRQPARVRLSGKAIVLVLVTLVCMAAITGAYYWHYQQVQRLQKRVDTLSAQVATAKKQQTVTATLAAPSGTTPSVVAKTYTYTPKTGGLSLTLPITLAVIVNVDGNKGGAPGAAFRVASAISDNVFGDNAYQGVEIDIDHTFTSLADAVTSTESQLQQAGNTDFEVTDTKVAGLPAKLIACNGPDEYIGKVSTYVVGSGEFTYTITANGMQFVTPDPDILGAVLKGIAIQAKTL